MINHHTFALVGSPQNGHFFHDSQFENLQIVRTFHEDWTPRLECGRLRTNCFGKPMGLILLLQIKVDCMYTLVIQPIRVVLFFAISHFTFPKNVPKKTHPKTHSFSETNQHHQVIQCDQTLSPNWRSLLL